MPRTHRLLFAALLFVCLHAAAARADTVVITGGYLSQQPSAGNTYDLTGDGFRASGWGNSGRTFCRPCPPGTYTNFVANYEGEDMLKWGPATFGGTDYAQLFYTGRLTLTIDTINLPADGATGLITLHLPFTLSGHLSAHTQNPFVGPTGTTVFSVDVVGQGVAEFVLSSSFIPGIGQTYNIQSMTYRFQPASVPEPASLLLLATGLGTAAAAAARRRRRGARRGTTPD